MFVCIGRVQKQLFLINWIYFWLVCKIRSVSQYANKLYVCCAAMMPYGYSVFFAKSNDFFCWGRSNHEDLHLCLISSLSFLLRWLDLDTTVSACLGRNLSLCVNIISITCWPCYALWTEVRLEGVLAYLHPELVLLCFRGAWRSLWTILPII